MYNQVHQEQIVAGETTPNIVEIPIVQEQVIVQEIHQVPTMDWTPEQIVETIGVLPQERVLQHAAVQTVHVPVRQTQEQSAVPVNSQFSITAVEASQVVDSCSLSEEFAAPDEVTTFNTSSTSSSLTADRLITTTTGPRVGIDMSRESNAPFA